jgi:hypothetical protein
MSVVSELVVFLLFKNQVQKIIPDENGAGFVRGLRALMLRC